MRTDYLGLEAFLFIAEFGSFRRAAHYLNLTQTAVSHRLRKLEDNLGVQLIVRSTRGVSLTRAGVELLPKVRSLFGEIDDCLDGIKEQGGARRTKLFIACIPTLAHYLLPPVVRIFRERYGDIDVKTFETSAREIGNLVSDSTVELALSIIGANRWDLDAAPLLRESYVLVCPRDHPFSGLSSVTWKDVAGQPLIRVSPETGNRMILDEALEARNLSLRWSHEVQHSVTALSFVAAGVGLTVTPRMVAKGATDRRCSILEIRRPSVERTVAVLRRRNEPLSRQADNFLSLLVAHASSLKE
ncbi:MAG: LysR family transcriptional regulator [Hyphomicrobiaceae bacterium]